MISRAQPKAKFPVMQKADLDFFAAIGFTTGEMAKAVGFAPVTIRKYAGKFEVDFPNKPSAIRRFHKGYQIISESGCWIWTATDRGNGYGCLMDGNRLISAHRFSYEIYHGAIASGNVICHRCDVPACVNPAHLFSGTSQENMLDKLAKGRANTPSGERHHAAKLSSSDVDLIMNSGKSGVDLAVQLGVTSSAISKVRRGVTQKQRAKICQ